MIHPDHIITINKENTGTKKSDEPLFLCIDINNTSDTPGISSDTSSISSDTSSISSDTSSISSDTSSISSEATSFSWYIHQNDDKSTTLFDSCSMIKELKSENQIEFDTIKKAEISIKGYPKRVVTYEIVEYELKD